MARIDRVNFVDLDIDWVCSCGEENDFTSIIKTDDFVECLECGRKFHVKVRIIIEDAE